jgi:hypothetical protein
MKVDVKLAGNSYSGVPSVLIPLKSGGKARFCEVSDTTAKASDVAQGKTFYDADGNYTEGTSTGSGGTAAEAAPYKVTIQQSKHQTISAVFTPQITGSVSSLERSGSTSQNLTSETKVVLGYSFQIRVKADKGWISGRASVSGNLKDGLICGDAVITVTEATPLPTDITVPDGYTPVYLYQNKLYTDESLNSPLTSKSQIASGSSLYVVDISHDATSLHQLLDPSSENKADVGCDEICVDLGDITKSNITDLGSAFLGNGNLESADLSGFGDINALYSLFAYCTSLKCVYFDTLCNTGKGELNTYHTLSTCKNLEYLVLDNVNVDFVVENVNDVERGIPGKTTILVPRAALDIYKANSRWSAASDRILAMEDFDIVRKDGTVTVTPKAV